ncbi:hypothetical protein BH10PSE17_BH10PSE17_37930 [soil metagenome]
MVRFSALFELFGQAPDAGAVDELIDRYRESYRLAERPVAGARVLLERLRTLGLKIGIVTNSVVVEQVSKIARLEFEGLIDALVVSEGVGLVKPDPRIFQEALRLLDCPASEAVMIGDSWQADMEGARAAGLRAIWLNRHGARVPDAGVAVECTSLEPVERILDLIGYGTDPLVQGHPAH